MKLLKITNINFAYTMSKTQARFVSKCNTVHAAGSLNLQQA